MSTKNRSLPYPALLAVATFLAGVIWLILDTIFKSNRITGAHVKEKPVDFLLPEESIEVEPLAQDDLTKIDGIGPKVSAILINAGVRTYTQLADTSHQVLKEILVHSGNRISDPGTWPEQAALAARGAWDQLKTLQAEFKGGRRPA